MVKKGININIQKKDLWLISAVFVFLLGAGFVIAIGENYNVHGHGHTEINLPSCSPGQVLKKTTSGWGCASDDGGGIKTWDSGWFAIENGQNLVLNHNLGSTALIYKVYGATTSTGSSMMEINDAEWTEDYFSTTGYSIQNIGANSFKFIAGSSGYTFMDDNGKAQAPTSSRAFNHVRIIAIKI